MKQDAVHPQVSISPRELQKRLEEKIPTEIVDVRTPPEYAAAHLPAAKLIPLHELDVAAVLRGRARPEEPLYVLCQSGNRARKAIEKFARAGFYNCVLIEGGMDECMACGLEIDRGDVRVLPLMRQVQITVGLLVAAGSLLALTVDSRLAGIPLFFGSGLLFAGLTGKCGLALLLAKMPWNRQGGGAKADCCGVGANS